MVYLTVSGSPAAASANSRFLAALGELTEASVIAAPDISQLPVFQPDRDRAPWPADAVKNALDWLASSGELKPMCTRRSDG